MRHHHRLLTVVASLLLAVAACAERRPPEGPNLAREAAGAAELQPGKPPGVLPLEKLHHAGDHMGEWALELVQAIDTARDLSGRAHGRAVTLLARLDFLLREHVVLATYATEAAVSGDRPVEPARHALEANTDELRRELFELFGTQLAERFKRVWRQHLDALVAYGRAVGERDAARERAAREDLDKFVRDFGDFVADLTLGKLEEAEVRTGLRRHVDTLLAVADAQAEGPAGWYEHVEAAIHEVAVLAEALAAGVSQQAVLAGDTNTEMAILRAELGGALADSVFFTAYASRAALAGDAPAEAATDELLRSNTHELEAILRRALDREAALAFGEVWSRHHEDFLAYAEAVKEGDDEGRHQVLERLKHFTEELGEVLEKATDETIGKDVVANDAAKHVRTVTEVIDAQAEFLAA